MAASKTAFFMKNGIEAFFVDKNCKFVNMFHCLFSMKFHHRRHHTIIREISTQINIMICIACYKEQITINATSTTKKQSTRLISIT